MEGSENQPGIIKRLLSVVFNSIKDYQADPFVMRPNKSNGIDIIVWPMKLLWNAVCMHVYFSILVDFIRGLDWVSEFTVIQDEGEAREIRRISGAHTKTHTEDDPLNIYHDKIVWFEHYNKDVGCNWLTHWQIEVDPDCRYAVFVSYVEIYNEVVYDLLEPPLKESMLIWLGCCHNFLINSSSVDY